MSVARVYVVKKARKAQRPCSKCGAAINPGDGYRYWEPYFRSNYKVTRCMKSECTPRPSERESSAMATVLAAQESAEDTISAWTGEDGSVSELESARDSVVEALDEVIDQYREADENFGGGGMTQSGERADDLESQKDELESVDFEEFDESSWEQCEDAETDDHDQDTCDDCQEARSQAIQDWADEQRSILEDALGNIG